MDRSVPNVITGFMAQSDETAIYLSWNISHEADTTTYLIYRKTDTDDDYSLYN